jgi:hypothetical protein
MGITLDEALAELGVDARATARIEEGRGRLRAAMDMLSTRG